MHPLGYNLLCLSGFTLGLKISYWQKGKTLISHDQGPYWEGSSHLMWKENIVGKTCDAEISGVS